MLLSVRWPRKPLDSSELHIGQGNFSQDDVGWIFETAFVLKTRLGLCGWLHPFHVKYLFRATYTSSAGQRPTQLNTQFS